MAFEFFRKHQKVILFTAGLFALVSFSISGALLGFFDSLRSGSGPLPTFKTPDGREVEVSLEDNNVGRALADGRSGGVVQLPALDPEEAKDRGPDIFGFLRRAAIESGIDFSYVEVDAAIDKYGTDYLNLMQQFQRQQPEMAAPVKPSVRELAAQFRCSSVDEFRKLVGEAMRISTFLRMNALACDTSSAVLVESLMRKKVNELVTYQVANFDKKEEETKFKLTPVSDDDLKAWLNGLAETDQSPYRLPQNKVALQAFGLSHAEFDASQWTEELKGKEYGEEQLRQRYDQYRELRYRRPPPPSPVDGQKPPENPEQPKNPEKEGEKKGGPMLGEAQDPTQSGTATAPTSAPTSAPSTVPTSGPSELQGPQVPDPYIPFDQVKAAIQKEMQAEDVMRSLWAKVQEGMYKHMQPTVDARNKVAEEAAAADQAVTDAETKLAGAADNAELKKAVEDAKTAAKAKTDARIAAETAVQDARRAYLVEPVFTELTKGKSGAITHRVTEPTKSDDLRELGPFGKWDAAWRAGAMESEGDISSPDVQTSDKASFLFQVLKVIKRPLKDFTEIKTQLTEDFYKRKADDLAKEKTKLFEEKLLALAKEKRKTEVSKIEEDQKKSIDELLTKWRTERQQELESARANIAKIRDVNSPTRKSWQSKATELEQKLAKEAERKTEIEKDVAKETETKVKAEAKKAYADVLAEAAQAVGMTVKTLGPLPRNVYTQPRFQYDYPEDVRYLYGSAMIGSGTTMTSVRDMKLGEATDLLDDASNRALRLAVVTAVEKPKPDSFSRRDLMAARREFESSRMRDMVTQSFTIAAIEQRHDYRRPKSETSGEQDPGKN